MTIKCATTKPHLFFCIDECTVFKAISIFYSLWWLITITVIATLFNSGSSTTIPKLSSTVLI
jgi:hypothetical protein